MDIKVVIDKESKERLFSNLSQNQNTKAHNQYNGLIFYIKYSEIDIDGFPTDVVNIIKEYCCDKISFRYFAHTYGLGEIPSASTNIYNDKIELLQKYHISINLNIKKRDEYISVICGYNIDQNIMKTYNEISQYNSQTPNLIAVINHYMKEKYNHYDYIPYIIDNNPKIISKQKNIYQSISAHDGVFNIVSIHIIDEYLFEIISSLINELTKCLVEYLNEKN